MYLRKQEQSQYRRKPPSPDKSIQNNNKNMKKGSPVRAPYVPCSLLVYGAKDQWLEGFAVVNFNSL